MRSSIVSACQLVSLFPTQRRKHRAQLETRLGVLAIGIRSGDNTTAGEERSFSALQQRRANRHRKLALAVRIHPADRRGIPATIHALEAADYFQRGRAWDTAHGRCGMQAGDEIEDAAPTIGATNDRRKQ